MQLSDTFPVKSRHHLELQGEESDLLASYFKDGIFYLEGGVDSGFRHVEPETYELTLLHVKGRRHPRVWPLAPKGDNLNDGDVFILDNGMELFLWHGAQSNINEQSKALWTMYNIRDKERNCKPEVFHPQED